MSEQTDGERLRREIDEQRNIILGSRQIHLRQIDSLDAQLQILDLILTNVPVSAPAPEPESQPESIGTNVE